LRNSSVAVPTDNADPMILGTALGDTLVGWKSGTNLVAHR
jgi:hypothetical protein